MRVEAVAVDQTFDEHLAAATAETSPVSVPEAPVAPAIDAPPVVPAAPVDELDEEAPAAPATEASKAAAGRKKTARERIAELQWEKHEERRARERVEAELQALKQPKPAEPAADPTPRLKSYIQQVGTTYATYEDASEAYSVAFHEFKSAQDRQASAEASAQRAYQDALMATRNRGVEKHADFDAKLEALASAGFVFTPWMTQAILDDADQGHDLAYALATEAETWDALRSATTPVQFAKRLGKILTRLEGATPGASPVAPVKSTAVPPLTPVTSSPVAVVPESSDDESLDAHIARETKAERARRSYSGRR